MPSQSDDTNRKFRRVESQVSAHDKRIEELERKLNEKSHVDTAAGLIDIDPNDPLSEFDEDWFVKDCRELVDVLKSQDDPEWRPEIEKTGDPVLDTINATIALMDTWKD